MAFLSLWEVFDIVLMSFVVGFIFKDALRPPVFARDPDSFIKNVTPGMSLHKLSDFWYAVLLVAPAIIFHEFGHKFVAMAFGLSAEFHAAYLWLGIALVLKLVLPGFIFFIPAYVSISGGATPLAHSLIAFSGPAVNLVFWLGSAAVLKWGFTGSRTRRRSHHDVEKLRFLNLFRRINMFLFILNMIPIPGFDGFHVLRGVWTLFSG